MLNIKQYEEKIERVKNLFKPDRQVFSYIFIIIHLDFYPPLLVFFLSLLYLLFIHTHSAGLRNQESFWYRNALNLLNINLDFYLLIILIVLSP